MAIGMIYFCAGGVRLAVLSVVAGTHLLNLAIDQQVGDVVRFFYSAAGLQLLRKPVAVAKARDIIGVWEPLIIPQSSVSYHEFMNLLLSNPSHPALGSFC